VGGTLTLVDGERMVPYPLSDDSQRNFVDITEIPFSVVQRIDVLKDGASAAYGSDAIAGVVNVVLKKKFTGLQVDADAGTSQHSDGTTAHVSVIGGIGDLGGDGYNAYLAFEFRHQDPILLRDRSGLWTNQNWTSFSGVDPTTGNQVQGNDLRPGSYNPNEIPYPRLLSSYVLNPATSSLDATTNILNTSGCASYAAYTANQCLVPNTAQLQPSTNNYNALGRLTKNLGGDWQLVVTGSFFRSEADQLNGFPSPYPRLNGLGPTSLTNYGPSVFAPFVVTTPPVLLPVGAANNPFPDPAPLVGNFYQLGPTQATFDTNTYRIFTELQGNLAGWQVDASAGYMYSVLTQTLFGEINPGALAQAANSGFNFATATGAQMAAAFANAVSVDDSNTMEVVDLHGTRELAKLPGGWLALAVGVGYNHLNKDSPAPTTVTNALQQGNGAFAFGETTNENAYAEVDAPLLRNVDLDVAGRWDHYDTYGSSKTPKVGLKYTPIKLLTLRGTYSEGFRAPNPAEAGNSRALFGGAPYNDPLLCPNPANPNAAGNFPSQCNLGVTGLQISTPTLKPETSENWTAGFILQPVDNVDLAIDYWSVKVNQDIQSGTNLYFLGADPSLFPVVRGAPTPLPFCTADNVCTTVQTTPVGPVAYQAFAYFNATQTRVSGVDLDFASHFDLGSAGKLTAKVDVAYIQHYQFSFGGTTYELAGTHGPQIISGDTGNPRTRGTASLSWDQGPLDVTASLTYVGHFNLTDPTSGLPDCYTAILNGGSGPSRFLNGVPQSVLNSYCEVGSFTSVDLFSQYMITDKLKLRLTIQNLFNTPPPIDLQTYGAAGNAPYNPAMHQAGAIGRFFSVGATYTF
jgi:iron complex outermembrane receptor protein